MRSVSILKNNFFLFFLFLLLIFFNGCTADKRLLSFFFDGVPQNHSNSQNSGLKESGTAEEEKNTTVKTVTSKKVNKIKSFHKPFKEKKCDKCHDRSREDFLVAPKDKLCFQCHDRKKFFNRFTHGPVAPGRCLACHYPHKSVNPYLLKYTNEKLCFQCHNSADIAKIKGHKNRADCLKCHDPHTQDNRYFLKPDAKEKFGVI